MNLGANDGYPAYMGVFSESDEEYDGKRIRTYSYDPEKFDLSSHNDDIDWKHNPNDSLQLDYNKIKEQAKYSSHVVCQQKLSPVAKEPIKEIKKKKKPKKEKPKRVGLLDSEDENIDLGNLNCGMIVTKKQR